MDVTFVIELACRIRDCVYVSGIKVQALFFHYIRSLTVWTSGTELSRQSERWSWDLLLQWQWDNQHDPWPPGTSLSQLILNSSAPLQCWCFPGYHFFPLQYSCLPALFLVHCAHPQQGSALTLSSFESFLAFFLEYYGNLGMKNAYSKELKSQRAVFLLSVAAPNSSPPGTTLLDVFHFVQWESSFSNCIPLKSVSGTQRQL